LHSFFKGTRRFLSIDMLDPEAGEKICAFAQLPPRPLPHITNPKREVPRVEYERA
jgi:hypothetical protein